MSQNRFHTLKVTELRQETDDCRSIRLDWPEELRDTFNYKPGQYLTFRTKIKGEELRRSYSLCSSPLEEELRVAVKRIPDGKFSTYANEVLAEGDVLEVMPPMGNFHVEPSPSQSKTYVAFAAGSGITPILSIIKTVLRTEPDSRFTLLFGNRNVHSIIFKEELEGLKNLYLNRFQVYHFLTREMQDNPLFNGRLDSEKIGILLNTLVDVEDTDDYFLCGPEEMIMSAKNALEQRGVDAHKVHFELFTTPGSKNESQAKSKKKRKPSGHVSLVTVKDSGSSYQFELSQGTENILDAAMLNGADLPYACKGGVCCTCKAKLLEGQVEMEANYALEPEEVEQGFILTCQAYPLSETVVVDFDQAL